MVAQVNNPLRYQLIDIQSVLCEMVVVGKCHQPRFCNFYLPRLNAKSR